VEVEDPTVMPGRLAAFLALQHPDVSDVEVTSYEVMTGGYSRLLARAAVTWRRAGTPEQRTFVLRGDPPPDRSLIQTDRHDEWDVLRTVAGRCRVAAPLYFDATGEHLGTIALVLEHSAATSLLPYCAGRDDVGELPTRLAEAAASIHTIPIDELPACIERPTSYDDYLSARIDEWRRTDAAHVESDPFLRYVAAWLDAHRPPPVPLTLIHGDFQSANMLVDDDGHLVLLDWELAQVGDPREDLGYFKAVAQAAPPDLTDAEEFCARYRELTGFDEAQVNPAVVAYFLVLGVIGTVRRLLEGGAAFARGENHLLASLFNLNSVQFGHSIWLQTSMQLEPALAPTGAAPC
jgi:aminoglycoside phosphotransferase (APT) family kinase protein